MSLTDSEIKSAIKKIVKKSPGITTSQIFGEIAKEFEYEESELADQKKRIRSLISEVIASDDEKPEKEEKKSSSKGKRKASQSKKKKESEDENSDSDEKPKKKRKEGNVKNFVVESESDNEDKSGGSDSEEVVRKKPKKAASKKKPTTDDSSSKEVKQLKNICRRAFITIPKAVNSTSGNELISKLKELLEDAGLSGKLSKEKVESFIEERERTRFSFHRGFNIIELNELLGTSKKLKIDLNAPRTMRARKQVNYAKKIKIDSEESSSESEQEPESNDEKNESGESEASGKEEKD